jgi:tetratricopeptide (TPR) repeat protein
MNDEVEYTAEELWDLIPRTSGKERADVMISLAEKVGHQSKEQALSLIETAREIYEVYGDEELEAHALQDAGHFLGEMSQFAEAIDKYQKAVSIYTEIQDLEEVANCFEKLAEFKLELGENVEAISYGQRALDISSYIFRPEMQARIYLLLTKAFLGLGDLDKSGQHLMDAQALANYATEKNWKLIAEVEEARISHLRASGFADVAAEAEVRLRTLKELVR